MPTSGSYDTTDLNNKVKDNFSKTKICSASSEERVFRDCTVFIGIGDVLQRNKLIWKAALAEFVGTFVLVFIGAGSCTSGWIEPEVKPSILQIALAFGLAVATMAQAVGHISGAHLNPAVTVGLLVTAKCSLVKAGIYIFMQCVGAIAGAATLQALTPEKFGLGVTNVSKYLSPIQGLFVEFIITFVLVITVYGVTDGHRKDIKGSAPLAIGLAVGLCHLMAINYTGSSMNPARSLGPAVITGDYTNHWVYWIGPMLGGIAAGLMYQFCFQSKSETDEENEEF